MTQLRVAARVGVTRADAAGRAPHQSRTTQINTALARGLAVLRAFRHDDAFLGNAELSERTGIPKATLSRLTFTLAELGYLRRLVEIDKFEVAPGVVALGYQFFSSLPFLTTARPLIADLADRFQANAGLAIRNDLEAVFLEYFPAERNVRRVSRIGFSIPLIGSATGYACLAAMTASEFDEASIQLKRKQPRRWRSELSRMEAAVSEIRRNGFCVVLGSLDPAMNAVAAPFVDPVNRRIYSVTCHGTADTFNETRLRREIGPRLAATAREVSEEAAKVLPFVV